MNKFARKSMWNRLRITVLVSLLATILFLPGSSDRNMVKAWWGTLYPQFCYSQIPDSTNEEPVKVRIKFRWLHGL